VTEKRVVWNGCRS